MNKRILILTGVFLEEIGGPPTLLKALNLELIKRGYQVTVLTFGSKKEAKKYPYPVKVVSDRWPYFIQSPLYLLKGMLLSLRVDVLYNLDLYVAGFAGLLIKKFLGKKLVTRFVGDPAWEIALNQGITQDDIFDFQDKKYSFLIEQRRRARKKILGNSDKVIVVSYFLKKLAIKIGLPEEKIKVIYNSIDFLDIKGDPKINLKKELNISGKVILTNARLTPWKGVDMLIKLMPKLIKKYEDIKFVIISDGPERKNLEKLAIDLDVEEYILFVGRVSRKLVVEYLKISDVFVLNTNYEGMSFSILEAIKVGLPVITTPAGGNPETIKDKETGLLVEYRNKEQWLEAINSVLDNKELAGRFVANAKEDLKRFSWNDLVEKTIRVFEKL